ncbi:MAG: hypothetical protein ACXVHC_08755 [Frankiaceae bacterium]
MQTASARSGLRRAGRHNLAGVRGTLPDDGYRYQVDDGRLVVIPSLG